MSLARFSKNIASLYWLNVERSKDDNVRQQNESNNIFTI